MRDRLAPVVRQLPVVATGVVVFGPFVGGLDPPLADQLSQRALEVAGFEPDPPVRPLQDRLLVRRVEEATTPKGGIIIPDAAKERPLEGNVIAVGSGKRLEDGTLIELDVKPGDRVLFGKYSGTEIKVDGVDHIILREDEVLGVIES